MTRKPRIEIPGGLYHIITRANNRQLISLAAYQSAAALINSHADSLTAEEARILGGLRAIAVAPSDFSRAKSDFRAEGIPEMEGSRAVMHPEGMNSIKGVYFASYNDVVYEPLMFGAQVTASILFHEAFHVEEHKLGDYDEGKMAPLTRRLTSPGLK